MVKRTIINIILIGCLVLIESCNTHFARNYKYSKPPFSLRQYSLLLETKLDTSSYYFNQWDAFRENRIVKLFHVMKFYANGTFQFETLENLDTIDSLSNPTNETMHYYKIEDGVLKLEVYGNSMVGFDYWQGNVYEDSIIFFKINRRKEHLVYRKMQ